jgi:LysR family nitrogen assimilation transcriptional regulator
VDIRQLRYFIAIAEEGSLSAAAHRLRIAQPSLSQHVTKIEQELGVTLVWRSPRGIKLTESGDVLLRHAREICQSMNVCQEMVRVSGHTIKGSVTFGLPCSISAVLSVPLAETVRVNLPSVKLRIIEAMSGFIRHWLQDESIDIGLLYDVEDAKLFGAQELMQEELDFFAAVDNWPLKRRLPGEDLPLAEISRLELVLPSQQHALRTIIDSYARKRGIDLNIGLEMDSLNRIKELVARGSYFTILAPVAAYDGTARGELVASRIVDPIMTRSVYMLRKLKRPQSCVTSDVEQITYEVIQDLVGRGIWKVSKNLMDGCVEKRLRRAPAAINKTAARSAEPLRSSIHSSCP